MADRQHDCGQKKKNAKERSVFADRIFSFYRRLFSSL
jgi:hypothetical protein